MSQLCGIERRCKPNSNSSSKATKVGDILSRVGLSKYKKAALYSAFPPRASDWPSRQHGNWDKWDKHIGVLYYTLASLLHFRQYSFLPDGACLSLSACAFTCVWGERGKRGTNCTLTHHWTTFSFGNKSADLCYVPPWHDTCVSLLLSKRKSHINLSLCMSKGCHGTRT